MLLLGSEVGSCVPPHSLGIPHSYKFSHASFIFKRESFFPHAVPISHVPLEGDLFPHRETHSLALPGLCARTGL